MNLPINWQNVYERAAFNDWSRFSVKSAKLERLVTDTFSNLSVPFLKLVGSSSTKTSRKGKEDLDYAVAFDQDFDFTEFQEIIERVGLNIRKIKFNEKHKYLKISGVFEDTDFVLVPMVNPNSNIAGYEQDAFYHPDFINSRKGSEHEKNVILAKEFFSQIGVYKAVKGIGCELLVLQFEDFEGVLRQFVERDEIRVNFSGVDSNYSRSPLVIDYIYLGGRSFTEKVNHYMYQHIRNCASQVLENPDLLKGDVALNE